MSIAVLITTVGLSASPWSQDLTRRRALDECIIQGSYREAAAIPSLEPGQGEIVGKRIMASCAEFAELAFDEADAEAGHADLTPEERHAIFQAVSEKEAQALVEELVRAAKHKPKQR